MKRLTSLIAVEMLAWTTPSSEPKLFFSRTAGSEDSANFQFFSSMFCLNSSTGVEANSSTAMDGAFGSDASAPCWANQSEPKLVSRTAPGECLYLTPQVNPRQRKMA